MPIIYQEARPDILHNDMLISGGANQFSYTIFDDALSLFVANKKIDLFKIIFFVSVVSRYLFFYSLYGITVYITDNEIFSALSLILFIGGSAIFGTASSLFERYLIPQNIGIAFSLASLSFFLRGRKWQAAIFFWISGLIHPIITLPLGIFYSIQAVKKIP